MNERRLGSSRNGIQMQANGFLSFRWHINRHAVVEPVTNLTANAGQTRYFRNLSLSTARIKSEKFVWIKNSLNKYKIVTIGEDVTCCIGYNEHRVAIF